MRRTMRVMVDARMLIGAFGGVARYVTRLIDELAGREGIEIVALCADEFCRRWEGRPAVSVVRTSFGREDRTAARRWRWEVRNLPGYIRDHGVDLFHATWNSGIPRSCPVPAVLTVHDLIPLHDPKAYFTRRRDLSAYRHALGMSVRRAAAVMTVSRYVRREVIERLGTDVACVVAIHNGVDQSLTGVPPDGEDPYVLCVGGAERRKNVNGVLAAMELYRRRYGEELELRLTGDRDERAPDAVDQCRRLAPMLRVRFLGPIDDAALSAQYAGARALLMLSRDEGFGLPVLEAMAHGCPVVAAAASALPEVAGDAAVLVSPDDADAAADAVHRFHTNAAFRSTYVARGLARARRFGWDRTASAVCRVYTQVLDRWERCPLSVVRCQ